MFGNLTEETICDIGVLCANGGTCVPNGNEFSCICAPDFTGTYCQTQTSIISTTLPISTCDVFVS